MSSDSALLSGLASAEPGHDGRSGWLGWSLLICVGLLAIAGAAWQGYRQQLITDPARSGEAAPTGERSRTSGATTGAKSTSSHAPVAKRVVQSARGTAASAADPAQTAALRWPLWEFQLRQPIPPRNPPLTPPAWRLIGATLSADGWKVVIVRQGVAAPEYFGVGSVLPGGYKIQAITDEDVTFDINKREVVLSYTGSR